MDDQLRPLGRVKIWRDGALVGQAEDSGAFEIARVRPDGREALTFAAEGHVPNTRVYEARVAGNGNTIVVWPRGPQVAFDTSHELDVTLGGSRIRLPARALTRDHKPYAGRARLAFTLLDVASPRQRAAASGDFSGRMLDGSARRLSSFGIFELVIVDEDDRPLALARGASASLSIAVPRVLAARAPATVGFFDMDPDDGAWVQIGTFAFEPRSGTYAGAVNRFGSVGLDRPTTTHNLDVAQTTTCVTVQILHVFHPQLGLPPIPMANMNVVAHGAQSTVTGTSDASGYTCLVVEQGAPFTVTASGFAGSSYYTTVAPVAFTAPNLSSGAGDCGDPSMCPTLGIVAVDLIVGIDAAVKTAAR